jgi:hypothetical protein
MMGPMTFSQRLVARYAPANAATLPDRFLPFAYPDFFHLPPSVQRARVDMLKLQEDIGREQRGEWTWRRRR